MLREILANRADILIELGKHEEALASLEQIAREFKGRSADDMVRGLRCKLALRQKDWRTAEGYLIQTASKLSLVYMVLRRDILALKKDDPKLGSHERAQAEKEMEEIDQQLQRSGAGFIRPSLGEDVEPL